MDLEEDDLAYLRHCITGKVNGFHKQRLMRFRQTGEASPIVSLVLDHLMGRPEHVGFIASVVTWPDYLPQILKASFGLTPSETDVLKWLTLGKNVKEISDITGRSDGTIRTHIRALLSKTETRTQMELVRLTLGLFDVAFEYGQEEIGPTSVRSLNNIYHKLILKDGRRLDYLDLCHARGKPFILLPGNIGLCRLPAQTEGLMADLGLRMIVPVRAGYGYSTPLKPDMPALDTGIADVLALMDHLRLGAVPIVCMVSDLQLGTALAKAAPDRVSALIGASAMLPLVEPAHFARLDKFTRFAMASARRAPKSLGFVSMIFFAYAHRLGIRRFLELVLDGSEIDHEMLGRNDIMNALERGAHMMVRQDFKAHAAWSQDLISFTADWRDNLLTCPAPVTLLVGDQSPWVPLATARDFAARSSNIEVVPFENTGQLLAYQHPEALIGQLRRHIRL